MIPRKLHRVWLGDAPVPEEHAAFWQRWQELHPTWSCHTWGEADVENRGLFATLDTMSAKSDLLRYEILAREGGVYVDTDFEPLRPLDPLLDVGLTCFAAWEDENRVCTALMGAEQGHPAVRELLRRMPAWTAKHRKELPDTQTGPVFLTKTWNGRPDVQLLPSPLFYPVSYWKRGQLGKVAYPETSFAVHHWGRSWMPDDKRAEDDAAMRTVAFLVPRKADGGHRDEVWDWLRARWTRNFPAADIVEGHADPFNRAKAINQAAAQAPDADVYVILDADSWVDPAMVKRAIAETDSWILPWSLGYKVTRGYTRQLLTQDPNKARLFRKVVLKNLAEPEHHHLSGCVVVTRAAFEAVGGFDERFEGWGFEDTAFIYSLGGAADKERLPAALIHLWHPPAPDAGAPSVASIELFNQYRADAGLAPWRKGIDR